MKNQKRFECHSHTEYSNLRLVDSINKPISLVNRAAEIGLAGIAITDHETIAASIILNKYQKEISEKYPGFKIGIGNEIYLVDERHGNTPYYHFILIALDKEGHRQLRELSSRSWMQSYYDRGMERVPTTKAELSEEIKKNPGHIIASSACIGSEIGQNILSMTRARKVEDKQGEAAAYNAITAYLDYCLDLFGDNFYLEVAPGKSKEQIVVNNKIGQIANLYGVKRVIGTDAHYLRKEDRYIHKAYLNSKNGEREVDSFYEYAYLQTDDEIRENMPDEYPDSITDMYKNSMEIYEKIQIYDLTHSQTIPSVPVKNYNKKHDKEIEKYPTLIKMEGSDNEYERYWVNQCLDKLKEINKYNETYLSRLEEEADTKSVIGEKLHTNMFKYPITLQYYIDMIWDCGSIVGAGRGSSCSGLNHYLLGVTQLDPITWDFPFWRYLNKERTELGDIDIDLCPSKKTTILKRIKKERGERFNKEIDDLSRKNLGAVLVATFGTEGTRSAILTACRGYRDKDYPDGIDTDTAQFLASFVPSERGFSWSLSDMVYGNPDKDRKASNLFINEVKKYPGLLNIMFGIEGLINKRSSHASGVIFSDEDPYEFGCYMKTPKGEIITQYDLHDCESAGMTKYDMLVTEICDKIVQTIEFLQKYGQIEAGSLRDVYNKYLHPEILSLKDKNIWANIQSGTILNQFQFDSEVGSQAIKKIKPSNITELTDSNGLMRLMTGDGGENPMDKYVRYKNNIQLWYNEMDQWDLTKDEQKTLEPYFKPSYGVPPSQEQLMKMVMDPNICNFTLKESNDTRKIIGKKQMSRIPELKEKVLKSAKSEQLGKYVWQFGALPQMG